MSKHMSELLHWHTYIAANQQCTIGIAVLVLYASVEYNITLPRLNLLIVALVLRLTV